MRWSNRFTMRQLRAFVYVYRLGKFSDAATALSITPSAVSVLIHQMESVIGLTLFDRTTRTLRPTPAAQEAIGLAERILADLDGLGERLADLGAARTGRVIVAATPAISAACLPTVVRRFAQAHPGVQFVLEDCAPNDFLTRVLSGHVDLGLGTLDGDAPGLRQQVLRTERLCVLCAADHPLAALEQVPWSALAGQPVIAGEPGYGVRRLIDTTVARLGLHLRVVNEVHFLSSALWLAECGHGVVIFPEDLVRPHLGAGLACRPLVEPVVQRPISVIARADRGLSPAAQAFEAMVLASAQSG